MAADASVKSVEELRQFENALKEYLETLVQSTNNAVRAMNIVNQGWGDKVQIAFMHKFQEALNGIKNMAQLVDDRKRQIHESIEKLQDYQDTINRFS